MLRLVITSTHQYSYQTVLSLYIYSFSTLYFTNSVCKQSSTSASFTHATMSLLQNKHRGSSVINGKWLEKSNFHLIYDFKVHNRLIGCMDSTCFLSHGFDAANNIQLRILKDAFTMCTGKRKHASLVDNSFYNFATLL